jgi:phosphoribosyl-AMP cyclohydrolase
MPAARSGGLFYCPANMTLDFSKLDGLIPAVIQDQKSGRVLMVGFMNPEAFQKTVDSGNVTFFSRSRNRLWMKGESSGHVLKAKTISTDCDNDSLLIEVEALGPGVCHNGYESCFYRALRTGEWAESEKPTYDPKAVYRDGDAK